MLLTRRSVTVGSAAVAGATLALGPEASPPPPPSRQGVRRGRPGRARVAADLLPDGVRRPDAGAGLDAAGHPGGDALPIGAPILGFVSLAMHKAAQRSAHLGSSSESAAVARAAHDVLAHYFPGSAAKLAGDLALTLDPIGGHTKVKGSRIGADAARDISRAARATGGSMAASTTARRRGPASGSRRPPAATCWPRGWARCDRSSWRRRRPAARTRWLRPRGPRTTRRCGRSAAPCPPSARPHRRPSRSSTTARTRRSPWATR